jgi:predicted peptidase
MSAFRGKADMLFCAANVCLGPKADIGSNPKPTPSRALAQIATIACLTSGATTMKLLKIVAVLATYFIPALAPAESVSSDFAARTELLAIDTLTLSDSQFLAGDSNAKATITTGLFRIASGVGRLPVVVLQHGSGGMGGNIDMWARELNAMGVSTLALDGFTGRGLTSVNTSQGALGRLNFILDIYRALDVLAKHPRVDPQRIVLMGFSRGGQAALYASLKRFHKTWNK